MKKFRFFLFPFLLSLFVATLSNAQAGGVYFSGAYGFSQVDGKSGNSLIFDLDLGAKDLSLGFRVHVPYTSDDRGKVPAVTLNLKFYTGNEMDGFFFNIGGGIMDDGKDDEDTEEDESEIIYLAGNIGFGFVLRANQNFALLAGVDLASAATKTQITNMMSLYFGLMF